MYASTTLYSGLGRLQRPILAIIVVGAVLSAVGLFLDGDHFWRAYLLAYVFWLEVALGSLGLLMLHHLVGGRWSAHIRSLLEAAAMTLPLLALLFLPLLFGLTSLYPWLDPESMGQSALVEQKQLYLNPPFFLARALVYFGVWIGLAYFLNRASLAQARTGDPAWDRRMRRTSAGGLILYMLTATFAAYDWLMSLEPAWFSSIYGLLFIAGQGLAALAMAILGLHLLSRAMPSGQDWRQSFNDLGNMALAFVMIWAYLAFSQFLIIWTANLPEEAIWYVHRSQGGWLQVGMVLVGLHFVLPFLLLLSRRLKRRTSFLAALALVLLVARLLDLFWLIMPAFYPDGLHLHWLDGVLLLTLGAAWLALFVQQWMERPPLPIHDPRLGSDHEQPQTLAGQQSSPA